MKKLKNWLVLLSALLMLFSGSQAFATGMKESDDRTLSPYFFIPGNDPATDRLPLKATSASVTISGVIADVLVTQVYKNEGKKPLEAIYIFPASTRTAVYSMKMTIGKRIIEAQIKKREDAKKDYEQAKQEGKRASLLEQQRPNVFQMNVANIMPGDEIKVEMKYTELLVPTDRVYEFVYPTVVGPRYSNAKAGDVPPSEHWVANPYLRQGELSTTTFDINVAINAGMPIKDLTCNSHKINTLFSAPDAAKISLDKSEKNGGNRDYILRYRLDGDKIQTGLLLSQGEKENFFLLMLQPPKRIKKADIPGREYIFIVDVSGSMYGFPLDISKKLISNLIGKLRATDKFNVLLFSGGSTLLAEESLPATKENIQKAINVIEQQRGGGGTELLPALKRALSLKKDKDFSRTVVIVTDGYVTVEEEAFDLIRNNLGNANMFAFGIGSSVNRHIIEGMARVGMGEPFVITRQDQAAEQAESFRKMIQTPVLTQAKISFQGFNAYDVEPISIPDLLAERPVLIFGKWRGKLEGKIKLTGIAGDAKYTQTINVADYQPAAENAVLKYLWARHRITILSDYNKLRSDDKRVKEVTDLGLTYNLLTAYTSFVAVDNEVVNKDGKVTTVKQPLPLPEGVSDFAVGGNGMYAASPMMVKGMAITRGKEESKDASLTEQEVDKKGNSKIQITDVVTDKGLTKDEIRKVAQAHIVDIEKCFAASNWQGNSTINLTINPDGTVKKVEVIASGIDAKIKKCVSEQVKKWIFSVTANRQDIKVTIILKN
ncbi:MAG TPA: VIT domain-containing protein [Smithellaceae bacterium]|nr:VIT domain-containing protein [Smithellaceae bacterium]HRS89603.1 VIT domain-containing protein [Smithellaceae bacterium]HRV26336.1 VIT domain-containing protein [Smithellaceae bacterium]